MYESAGREGIAEAHSCLSAELTSSGQARRVVAATLATWGHDDLAWVAVLLTSELVSNAVVHAHSAPEVHLNASGVEHDLGGAVRGTNRDFNACGRQRPDGTAEASNQRGD